MTPYQQWQKEKYGNALADDFAADIMPEQEHEESELTDEQKAAAYAELEWQMWLMNDEKL